MRKLLIAILLLTAGGLALLAWEPPAPSAARNPVDAPGAHLTNATIGSEKMLPATSDSVGVPGSQVVAHKYRYLLEDLGATEAVRMRVLALLARREALVPDPGFGSEPSTPLDAARAVELAALDAALRRELAPAGYAAYELFRDSDVEQYQLDEFTGGIREIAPLDRAQERAVLEAKLRQRHLYAQLVATAGLERDSLSQVEREHAMSLVTRGLGDYQEAYLAEVAPLLDEHQYHALANFESTEFTVELERLQQIINTR